MWHVWETGEACRLFVGRPQGNTSTGRPRSTWKHNIETQLQEVGWGEMEWIELAQVRDRWRAVVNAVMKLRVP
jgi:hypothetical protein